MGIALEHGAIHERAGVALVGVADHVLDVGLVGGAERPLTAGGESAAATTAQAGVGDDLDDVLRSHLGEDLAQCRIAVHRDVLVDVLRVDDAAVTQHHAVLGLVEGGVGQGDVAKLVRLRLAVIVVDEALDTTTLEQVLGDDLFYVVRGDAAVERAVGVHDDDRAELAQAEAAGADELDLVLKIVLGDLFLEPILDLLASRGRAAGTATDKDL